MSTARPRLCWCSFTFASMLCVLAGAPTQALGSSDSNTMNVASSGSTRGNPQRVGEKSKAGEKRVARRENVKDRRQDHRENVKERRQDHRENVKDRRQDHRENVKDRRQDHREHVAEKRAAWRERFTETFRSRFDADGDGTLSESERASARVAAARRRVALAERLDSDRNGFISDAEWHKFHGGAHAIETDPLAHLEHIGEPPKTPEEHAARRAEINRRRLERLETMDTDGDGKIMRSEMEALRAARHADAEHARASAQRSKLTDAR